MAEVKSHEPSMVHCAVASDLDRFADIIKEAINETSYDFGFNFDNSRKHIWEYIVTQETDVLFIEHDEQVVAIALVAESLEFHERPLCYVGKFWVSQRGRSLGLGRHLVNAVLDWAESRKCSHTFITATAGLADREQRLFVNLMKRTGFVESGVVLFKVME